MLKHPRIQHESKTRGNAWLVLTLVLQVFASSLALAIVMHTALAQEPDVIVALGDSLTAGYGLSTEEGFVSRLHVALKAAGRLVRVVNAGVSGDTSAGGRARLDWALAEHPDLVIVELGANDALRGLNPASTYDNLDNIITRIRALDIEVLLTGMLAPPNLGRRYSEDFRSVYTRLATKHDVILYPFFLDGVAAERSLNQPDGLHPNAAGVDIIVEGIRPYVLRALDEVH